MGGSSMVRRRKGVNLGFGVLVFDEKLVGNSSFYSDFLLIARVGRRLKINAFSVLIQSGSC
jgi:hypothetical protein